MEQALAIAVDALNIVPLHMALARAYHDRGDHERAFGHYRDGNRIRAEIIRYEPTELTREVDEFLRMPIPEDEPEAGAGAQPIPIFLVSLPARDRRCSSRSSAGIRTSRPPANCLTCGQ